MALRDILRAEAQPFLQSGERIQAVFMAQTGPSPYLAALVGPLGLLGVKRYIIVSTDRAHLALTTSFRRPAKATGLASRLPRNTRIGPLSGAWAVSDLLGEPTRIHRRFHKDVEAADAGAGNGRPAHPEAPRSPNRPQQAPQRQSRQQQPSRPAAGVPAGWYVDPHRPGVQRYWDGTGWTNHTAAG